MIQEKKYTSSRYRIVYPLFLVLFLMIGIFITVNQSQKNQELSSHAAGTTTNCAISSSQIAVKQQEQQLFSDINQYRVSQKLGQLTFNSTLKQSAAWLSADMV